MSLELSHIAIASPEIEKLSKKLAVLGMGITENHEVPTEKVRAAMIPVDISESFRVELLEPTEDDSPIAKFLEKRPKGGIHHICFAVKELAQWETKLKEAGIEVLPPGIRPAARGMALFIHPRSMGGVLVELEELGS